MSSAVYAREFLGLEFEMTRFINLICSHKLGPLFLLLSFMFKDTLRTLLNAALADEVIIYDPSIIDFYLYDANTLMNFFESVYKVIVTKPPKGFEFVVCRLNPWAGSAFISGHKDVFASMRTAFFTHNAACGATVPRDLSNVVLSTWWHMCHNLDSVTQGIGYKNLYFNNLHKEMVPFLTECSQNVIDYLRHSPERVALYWQCDLTLPNEAAHVTPFLIGYGPVTSLEVDGNPGDDTDLESEYDPSTDMGDMNLDDGLEGPSTSNAAVRSLKRQVIENDKRSKESFERFKIAKTNVQEVGIPAIEIDHVLNMIKRFEASGGNMAALYEAMRVRPRTPDQVHDYNVSENGVTSADVTYDSDASSTTVVDGIVAQDDWEVYNSQAGSHSAFVNAEGSDNVSTSEEQSILNALTSEAISCDDNDPLEEIY